MNVKTKLYTNYKKILSDTITPVSIYLKIRDEYPNSILLESSDYQGNNNSFSYICCNPIASIKIHNDIMTKKYLNGSVDKISMNSEINLANEISKFKQLFEVERNDFKFIHNGLFGYLAYDAVQYFEDIDITKKQDRLNIPDVYYAAYQNIIAINHFKNEAYIFCHSTNKGFNNVLQIEELINNRNFTSYDFKTEGDVSSTLTDNDFLEHVKLAKEHCQRGDVFQLVLSRRFTQNFKGDEFNVYRALRSINPSPYLFFFDYGNFKIFGSSPEAQLIVKDRKAEIHPIAGTFKRTGNDTKDAELATKLSKDEKENAEHVMLVDLARNDLSRHGDHIQVENYREVQFFSHVIHLVSKVTSNMFPNAKTMQIVADTFPAGTLSGAPKYKAMQLINQYETCNRNFYGGAIGFMDFEGNFNHAIMIRTFLSKDHQLHLQAGAGIVSESNNENELQEVYNKLGALRNALEIAESL